MTMFMFSLAGVPPTGGLLRQAVDPAGAGLHQHRRATSWLAVFAVLMSLIGAYYYLRVVKVMYFDEPARTRRPGAQPRRQRAAGAQRRGRAGVRPAARRPDGPVPRRHHQGAGQLMRRAGAGRVRPMSDAHLREHGLRRSACCPRATSSKCGATTCACPTAPRATREYVVHPGAVAIVPLLDDGRLVLERQFRYPVGKVLLEIPGRQDRSGRIHAGLRAARAARGDRLPRRANGRVPACVHNAAAYSTEGIEIWFARGLSAGTQRLDVGEFLELCLMSEAELDAMRRPRRAQRRQDADRPAVAAEVARRPVDIGLGAARTQPPQG